MIGQRAETRRVAALSAEALYADLGHFGRRPIQLGWVAVVFPALVLNYLGQGALVLTDPAAAVNPFFLMAPGWALLPLVLLATMATVIASQALISGAYSITMQAIHLGYLPRVRIDHTSPREFGQVYLPAVNRALMVACVGLVLAFRSSEGLAAAYGIAVTATMIITTVLLLVVARERWGWPALAVTALGTVVLGLDLAFLGANVLKIPDGGWLPLAVGVGIFTVMTTWHGGRAHTAARRRLGASDLTAFVARTADIPRIEGTVIYLGAEPLHTPSALDANVDTHGGAAPPHRRGHGAGRGTGPHRPGPTRPGRRPGRGVHPGRPAVRVPPSPRRPDGAHCCRRWG